MTKKQAAEKVAKLRRLAEKAGSKEESQNAYRAIDKLILQYQLTDAELAVGAKAAAFDDLISSLDSFVRTRREQVPGSVMGAIEQVKKSTNEDEKAAAFDKIAVTVNLGNMLFGHNKTVAAIGDLLASVAEKHGIKL